MGLFERQAEPSGITIANSMNRNSTPIEAGGPAVIVRMR